jgi:hypothetical protein
MEFKNSRSKTSVRKLKLRRLLGFLGVLALAAAILGSAGYWLFVGWRARDLALKARDNLENANYRMAWLQSSSARELRPGEPEVLRTSAIIDAAFGRKESLDAWERLEDVQELTTEDQEQRARAAIRFADQAQFEEAVSALEAAGRNEVSARLRTASQLSRGDLGSAIEQARRGAAFSDDPRLRLDLAKLLLRRYVDDLASSPAEGSPARKAFNEMTAIVNSLQNDPEAGPEALAFGLTFLLPEPRMQKAWADTAMARMEPGNPALLPAATVLVDNKYGTPEQLHARMRSVFDAAPLERRAGYAAWLTRHGLARDSLTLITAQEAGENAKAFLARTEALGAAGNWDAVMVTAGAGGNVPESVRLVTLARAQYALRSDPVSGATSVGDALRAAAKEGTLPAAMQAADGFGAQKAVADSLVELSGDPAVAGLAFRLARERFGLAGDHSRLATAFLRARQAAPEDLSVRDYARYRALLEDPDGTPDLPAAEADVAAAPADPFVRITAALAKLRAGKKEEALSSFDDITVFYDRLPPGPQAVICAVIAANGQSERVTALSKAIDRAKLTADEAALLQGIP